VYSIERHTSRLAVHDRVERPSERDIHSQIPSSDEDGHGGSVNKCGHVGHRHRVDRSRVAMQLEPRAGVHGTRGRVEDETLFTAGGGMREREAPLEGDRRDGDHGVAAHRGIPSGIHEHESRVGLKRRRVGDERSGDVGVSSRRVNERAAVGVGVLETPFALLRRGLAVWTGHTVHDEAERLTAHVRVDRCDHSNHSLPVGV